MSINLVAAAINLTLYCALGWPSCLVFAVFSGFAALVFAISEARS